MRELCLWCVFVCLVYLSIYLSMNGGDEETYLGWFLSRWSSGDWRDFLFCTSPTQSTPPTISAVVYLRTWPWAYPNPLPLLFSPVAVSFPPTPSLFSPSITLSHHHLSVCFPDSSTLLLFFYSLLPWFYLSVSSFQSPPPPSLLSLRFFFEVVCSHPEGEV